MTDDKTYIIDPLTSLCKVALLYFMPEKTRLAISRHVLEIQDYNYYQCVIRIKNGDSRVDISNLNTPFIKAIKWYIIDCQEKADMDTDMCQSVRTIALFAIKGLKKLQKCTYNTDTSIKIILQYFINLLQSSLEDKWDESSCVKMDGNNGILSDRIKNNFDSHTINSIAKMLNDSDNGENSQEDINARIECVHKLLINRDCIFVKLMKEINTTL